MLWAPNIALCSFTWKPHPEGHSALLCMLFLMGRSIRLLWWGFLCDFLLDICKPPTWWQYFPVIIWSFTWKPLSALPLISARCLSSQLISAECLRIWFDGVFLFCLPTYLPIYLSISFTFPLLGLAVNLINTLSKPKLFLLLRIVHFLKHLKRSPEQTLLPL